ncbi:MAG: extracellular solute-binding protein [Ruminococcus sp.]|nr:extracellular solute-binding protein [Ruminococcus sp.]
MKNSNIRRYIAGVLALATIFSASSCSLSKSEDEMKNRNKNKNSSQGEQLTEEISLNSSYSSIDMDADIPLDYIDQTFYLKDSAKVIISGTKNGDNLIYMSDTDLTEFSQIKFDIDAPKNSQHYTRLTVSSDGTIYALVTLIDYGDFKLPDYDDPNFDYESFDYDAMNEAAKYTCTLYTLNTDGEIISENELTNLDKYGVNSEEDAVHIMDIISCPDGSLVIGLSGEEEKYCTMSAEGEITGQIDMGSIHWVNYSGNDSEGNAMFACYNEKGMAIMEIDTKAKKFTESNIKTDGDNELNYINGITGGIEEYNLLLTTSDSLLGADKDGNLTEIINWLDSDLKGDSVRSVIPLEDGDYIVYYEDYTTSKNGFLRLTKRDPEELANQTIITLGTIYSDTMLSTRITDFNKSQTKYRIKLSDYSKYNKWDDDGNQIGSAVKELKMDLVSGNAPDMIATYDYDIISELANKGAYADLYDFMKDDEDISKDDFLPNVLKASEVNGKLYGLSQSFGVVTLACKKKYTDKENWTFDDMVDLLNEYPDMDFSRFAYSKEAIFEYLVRCSGSFIDFKKNECHFDSDEFKNILEFCNKYPDDKDIINWETASQEEIQQYYEEREVALRNDKALFDNLNIYSFTSYTETVKGDFGDDITLVGFPSDDGKGAIISLNSTFAILDESPNKEICWEFIKSAFTEEAYEDLREYTDNLPTLKSAFEKSADASMEKPYYLNDDGEKQYYERTFYIGDEEIKVEPLTQKERDFIVDYIESADKMYNSYSEEITKIITDEVTKYFKGECTSQQACDMVQNRVSLLISEQG